MMYYWLLAIVLIVSCNQDVELPATQKSSDLRMPDLHDPYQLPNILGAKGAYVEEKSDTATVNSQAPKVDIDVSEKFDYYEIQRCPKGAKLETSGGDDPLTHNYSSESQKHEDYLYVWGMAAAGACTLLAGKHKSPTFIDYFGTDEIGGTDSFDFFYIMRPCLSAKRSIYGSKRTCSYAFARTNTIEGYINKVAVDQRDNLAKLASLRTRLEHRMMQMASVVRQKAYYLQNCEAKEFKKLAMQRRLSGIAKVVITAGAVTVATILSGGTAGTATFLVGSAAAQLGDKLFSGISNASANCPTTVYDKRNKEILADVKQTIADICKTRTSLGEKLNCQAEPPPAEEAMGQIAGDECAKAGLGQSCLGT